MIFLNAETGEEIDSIKNQSNIYMKANAIMLTIYLKKGVRNMNEVASFSLFDLINFKPILIALIVIVCIGFSFWFVKKRKNNAEH